MIKKVILIGYSGHALVVADTLIKAGYEIIGYLEKKEVSKNLLGIPYLGFEQNMQNLDKIRGIMVFPAIGDNAIREKVVEMFKKKGFKIPLAISTEAHVSERSHINEGTLICQGACISPFSFIGRGVIINTGSIIEHECQIEDYAHIAPGAVLNGNVTIGRGSLIGANAVIKQGIEIGRKVIIGAGAVVVKNIPDNSIWVGNPARKYLK